MAHTATRKMWLGIAAKVTVLVSQLHPEDKVTRAYLNTTKDERTVEMAVSAQGTHPICQEPKGVIIFNHPAHGDVEVGFECWAVECFVKVTTEGNEEDFFDQVFPIGVVGGQASTGNTNAARDDNNNNHGGGEEDLPQELHRLLNASTTPGAVI